MITIPLYFSFAEFKRKFEQDFKEWKKTYPDGREIDFLEEVKKEYVRYSVNGKGKKWEDKIKVNKITHYVHGREQTETKVEYIGIRHLGYILFNRMKDYIEESNNPYEEMNKPSLLFNISQEFDISEEIEDGFYIGYDIDFLTAASYMPFFREDNSNSKEIELTDTFVPPLDFLKNFNEYVPNRLRDGESKFENFLFSCRQISEWIEKRKEELEPKQPLSTEKEALEYSIIQFKGTKTEFIELVNALIANGNLLEEGEREKDNAFKILSEIFGVNTENHNQVLEGFKKRNNGKETMFLDKLKKSLLEKISK